MNIDRDTGHIYNDIEEEEKRKEQDYSLLDAETFSEIEEINPKDLYSYSEAFNDAVKVFFN